MKFPCPFRPHDHAVSLFDSRCRKCKRPFTLRELSKSVKWRIWHVVQTLSLTECWKCEFVSAITEPDCPRCKHPRSVRHAIRDEIERVRRTGHKFIEAATTVEVLSFQRKLVLGSVALLATLIALVIKFSLHRNAVVFFGLTIIYVMISALAAKLFIRREKFWNYVDRTSGLVKFAVVLNYFSGLLLLGCFLSVAKAPAGLLASLIGITAASAFLLFGYAWPLTASTLALFLGERDSVFDPTKPQGRQAKYNHPTS